MQRCHMRFPFMQRLSFFTRKVLRNVSTVRLDWTWTTIWAWPDDTEHLHVWFWPPAAAPAQTESCFSLSFLLAGTELTWCLNDSRPETIPGMMSQISSVWAASHTAEWKEMSLLSIWMCLQASLQHLFKMQNFLVLFKQISLQSMRSEMRSGDPNSKQAEDTGWKNVLFQLHKERCCPWQLLWNYSSMCSKLVIQLKVRV